LAKYLKKRGHETAFLALIEPEAFKPDEDVRVVGFDKNAIGLRHALKKLKEFLATEKPDVLFVRNWQYLYSIFKIADSLKIPVVYNTTHIKNCQPFLKENLFFGKNILDKTKGALVHYLNFRTLNKIAGIVTINKQHAQILKDLGMKLILPIYNSMEDNYLTFKKEKKQIVVWVNNIKRRKNPEIFLEIAEKLKNCGYEFLMIGEMQEERYRSLIENAQKLNPHIKYLGPRSVVEVDEILAASEILVNTCEIEGFGNNHIQAWLAECPTVVLNFDPDDIIKNERLGFHSQNFEQLIKDLKFLFANPRIRREMGERARLYVLQSHQMEKNVIVYEEFFEKIIAKK